MRHKKIRKILRGRFGTWIRNWVLSAIRVERVAKLLGYATTQRDTSTYNEEERFRIEQLVRERYRGVAIGYVTKKFEAYPQAVVIRKGTAFRGIVFINSFKEQSMSSATLKEKKIGYLYIGPLFFLSQLGFLLLMMSLFERLTRQSSRLNVLAEIQNPEIIVHLHSIIAPQNITPSIEAFAPSLEAQKVLNHFVAKVPQLDEVSVEGLKSRAEQTLFIRKREYKPLLTWLEHYKIRLDRGDSLVTVFYITANSLCNIKKRVWQCWASYPAHRTQYFEEVQKKLKQL